MAYSAQVFFPASMQDITPVVRISLQLELARGPMQAPFLPGRHAEPLAVVLHMCKEEAVSCHDHRVCAGCKLAQKGAAVTNCFPGAASETRSGRNTLVLRDSVRLYGLQALGVVRITVEEKTYRGGFEHHVKALVGVIQVAWEMSECKAVLVLALDEEVGGVMAVGAGIGRMEG